MCLESSYAEQQGQQPMLRKISDQHTVEVGIQALDDLLQKAGGQLSHVGHWSADLLPHCLWKLWSVRWKCARWRRQSSIRWRCCRIRCLVRWCLFRFAILLRKHEACLHVVFWGSKSSHTPPSSRYLPKRYTWNLKFARIFQFQPHYFSGVFSFIPPDVRMYGIFLPTLNPQNYSFVGK